LIRTVIMLAFWTAASSVAALVGFPWTLITGNVSLLYRISMWSALTGVRLAGVRVETVGLEKIDPARTYIYMSNHVSNLDPPILLPLIPRRTSVMAKKELFSYPILGKAMRLGALVPVDRGNRDAGIAAVREASKVLQQGISMSIFVEGKRSFDGKLLPFKKGPFYLAVQNNVPVVPITIVGTHYVMPKRRFAVKAGTAKIIFHDPIEPKDFGAREQLMLKVREVINSGLPPEYQEEAMFTTEDILRFPGQARDHEENAGTA
jgi:1-acyl-sn-glycerol-3-phosphate acyltransferase